MLLIKKFLIFLSLVLIFLLFEAIAIWPKFFLIFGTAMLFIAVSASLFILKRMAPLLDKLLFLVTPVFFILSAICANIFFDGFFYKTAFAIIIAAIVFLYLENLFAYFHTPAKYHIYSLENISGYINLISIFFIAFIAYGIKVLFGMNFYWIAAMGIIAFAVIGLFNYQALWMNKILPKTAKKDMLLSGLILVEVYLMIFFLSCSFYVAGLIFALAYYVLMGIIKYKLMDKLDRKIVLKYLSIGSLMMLLTLLTTKWR